MIIGINGFARSGKNTVGNIFVEKYGFKMMSFAEPLRKGLLAMNPIVTYEAVYNKHHEFSIEGFKCIRLQEIINDIGWEEGKVQYPEIRELMQRYGTEAGRDIHGSDCWIKIAEKEIRANPDQHYVITDLRFENERLMVSSFANGFVVKVTRPNVESVNTHISDQPLERINYIIANDGTIQDLEEKVDRLYKQYSGLELLMKQASKKRITNPRAMPY